MDEQSKLYYGHAESVEAAETMINFKLITDEWRLLVPPTPKIKHIPVNGGVIIQHVGVWFLLHKFHNQNTTLGITDQHTE